MADPKFSAFAQKFKSLIDSGDRFLLLTHVRPDGDAYGCILAMAHSLKKLGKDATLWSEDGMSDRYQFLPGSDWVKGGKPPEGKFDARIVMDNANIQRVGKIQLPSDPASPVVNIDHHASNPGYGDLSYIDSQRASCGEIIFDLLKTTKMPITLEAAKCLFVAISTDTGSFQYPAVTSETFKTAAELIEHGINLGEISQQTFESHPPRRLLLLREVLQSAKFDSHDQIGYFWIDRESYQKSGAKPEDTEGIIDHIRGIRPVRVAVLFEEVPEDGLIRMSFRSKDKRIDVNKVAQQFGGGGHSAASGARVVGNRTDVEKRVLDALRAELPKK
jgi:bifunctional oligoribonuclease and PAP phosphatase NrnA